MLRNVKVKKSLIQFKNGRIMKHLANLTMMANADIFSNILVFPIAIVDTYVYNIVSP